VGVKTEWSGGQCETEWNWVTGIRVVLSGLKTSQIGRWDWRSGALGGWRSVLREILALELRRIGGRWWASDRVRVCVAGWREYRTHCALFAEDPTWMDGMRVFWMNMWVR
jgi:hypothetical protein